MSLRRLVLTAGSMGMVAVGLAELTPPIGQMTDALTAAQRTADTVGADSLVIAATGLLAWAVWA
jgi:nucleoid-associated protein YgaU